MDGTRFAERPIASSSVSHRHSRGDALQAHGFAVHADPPPCAPGRKLRAIAGSRARSVAGMVGSGAGSGVRGRRSMRTASASIGKTGPDPGVGRVGAIVSGASRRGFRLARFGESGSRVGSWTTSWRRGSAAFSGNRRGRTRGRENLSADHGWKARRKAEGSSRRRTPARAVRAAGRR
jgi:hypothetical protein